MITTVNIYSANRYVYIISGMCVCFPQKWMPKEITSEVSPPSLGPPSTRLLGPRRILVGAAGDRGARQTVFPEDSQCKERP